MNKFKLNITTVLIIALLSFSCGNGNKENEQERRGRIRVISTITIIDDLVKQIGKDKIESSVICDVGTDPHTYKPKPGDPKKVSESDLVFINGFGLEHWIEEMVRNAGGNKKVITVTEGLTAITDEQGYGDPDPHLWFNVEYVKTYSKNIMEAFVLADPVNKEFYMNNYNSYVKELDKLHTDILEGVKQIPESQRVLITSHDAFRYFGKAYGFEVRGLQGISTEAKVQTEDVKNLIDYIKSKGLKSVFIETSVNPKLLEQISSETGAKVGGTLYSDSLGDPGKETGTYIGAVKYNVNTIINALK